MKIFETISNGLRAMRSSSEAEYYQLLARPDFDSLDEATAIKFARLMRDLGKDQSQVLKDHGAVHGAISNIGVLADAMEMQVEADVSAKRLEECRANHAAETARLTAALDARVRSAAIASGAVATRLEILASLLQTQRENAALFAAAEGASDRSAVGSMRNVMHSAGVGAVRLFPRQETQPHVEKALAAGSAALVTATPTPTTDRAGEAAAPQTNDAPNASPAAIRKADDEARATGQRGLMITGRGKQATIGGHG